MFFISVLLSSCDNRPSSNSYAEKYDKDNTDYDYEEDINYNEEDEYYSEHEDFEVPMEWVQCGVCLGFGTCGGCAGIGQRYSYSVYSGGEYISCEACNGSGLCNYCEESGMMGQVKW